MAISITARCYKEPAIIVILTYFENLDSKKTQQISWSWIIKKKKKTGENKETKKYCW